MTCRYPECPNEATYNVECRGEGLIEKRAVCDAHKLTAEIVCATFDWHLTVHPIAAGFEPERPS